MSYLLEVCGLAPSTLKEKSQKPTYQELERRLDEQQRELDAARTQLFHFYQKEELYSHQALMLEVEGKIRGLAEDELSKRDRIHSSQIESLTVALEKQKKKTRKLEHLQERMYSEIEEVTKNLFTEAYELVKQEAEAKEKMRLELLAATESLAQEKKRNEELERLLQKEHGLYTIDLSNSSKMPTLPLD